METYEQRLKRFQDGSPTEAILTLLNSIYSFFVSTELKEASEHRLTDLLFIGIHAVAEIVSENICGKKGLKGFKFYLENFVDGDKPDTKFSSIAKELNDWRNVLAHQWLSVQGHYFGFAYDIPEGWKKEADGTIVINPKIYFKYFSKNFCTIDKLRNSLTSRELQNANDRIIKKYRRK